MIDDFFHVFALLLWKYGAVCRNPRMPGTSNLFQSSRAAGAPGTATNPVNSARPGSELVRRIVVPSGR